MAAGLTLDVDFVGLIGSVQKNSAGKGQAHSFLTVRITVYVKVSFDEKRFLCMLRNACLIRMQYKSAGFITILTESGVQRKLALGQIVKKEKKKEKKERR